MCTRVVVFALLLAGFSVSRLQAQFDPVVLARWSILNPPPELTPVELYLSTDGGASWTLRGTPDSGRTMDIGLGLAVSPTGKLFLALNGWGRNPWPFYGAHFYASSDTGLTWSEMTAPTDSSVYDRNSAGVAAYSDSEIITYLVGASHSNNSVDSLLLVFRTSDGGTSWSVIDTILTPTTGYDPEGEMCGDENGVLYIAEWLSSASDPTCYRSTDGGYTWDNGTTISTDPSSNNSRSTGVVRMVGNLYAIVWSNTTSLKCYISTDDGASWSYLSTPSPDSSEGDGIASIGASRDSTLYVGAWDSDTGTGGTRVFRSTDFGLTWSLVSTIPGAASYSASALSFTSLAPASPVGVGSREQREKGTSLRLAGLPSALLIIPSAPVNVSLYDVSGRLVKSLFIERKTKVALRPGVYFVKPEKSSALKAVVQ